jgi:hypothetical protein
MATKTWNGCDADWYANSGGDWSPARDPAAPDDVVIGRDDVTLTGRRSRPGERNLAATDRADRPMTALSGNAEIRARAPRTSGTALLTED